MDVSALIFSLALLILVVLYVMQPLISRPTNQTAAPTSEISSLMAERERILEAIKELEFDNSIGKIPEELYPNQRNDLVRRGADVLRKLDAFNLDEDLPESDRPEITDESDNLVLNTKELDKKIEELISTRRSMREHSSSQFCHNCGKSVEPNDKFCSHCGSSIP